MNETSFCPNCGARISARARFCPSCGASQDEFLLPDERDDGPAPTFPTEAVIRAVKSLRGARGAGRRGPARADVPHRSGDPGAPAARACKRAAPPPPPPPRTFQDRIGAVHRQAAELSGLLRERLALPGIIGAAIAGAAAAGVVLVAGLADRAHHPRRVADRARRLRQASLLVETFRQAVGTLLAPMVDPGFLLAAAVAGSTR